MRELLAEEGYQVICCPKSQDAQSLIREKQPDMVILDICLEGIVSGWDILELMRRVPATKDLPVMVCSADAHFLKAHTDLLRQHSCEVLDKPFDLETLLAKIRSLVVPLVYLN